MSQLEQAAEADTAIEPPACIGVAGLLGLCAMVGALAVSASPYERLFVLLATHTAAILIHSVAMLATCSFLGVRVEQAGLFLGGALIRLRHRQTWFTLGWFPTGSFVKPKGMEEAELATDDSPRNSAEDWLAAPRVHRIAIAASGPLLLFVVALLCLRPAGLGQLVTSLPADIAAILREVTTNNGPSVTPSNAPAMGQAVDLLDEGFSRVLLGAICFYFCLLNMLPLPALNGGYILDQILRSVGVRIPRSVRDLGILGTMIFVLGTFTVIVIALAAAW